MIIHKKLNKKTFLIFINFKKLKQPCNYVATYSLNSHLNRFFNFFIIFYCNTNIRRALFYNFFSYNDYIYLNKYKFMGVENNISIFKFNKNTKNLKKLKIYLININLFFLKNSNHNNIKYLNCISFKKYNFNRTIILNYLFKIEFNYESNSFLLSKSSKRINHPYKYDFIKYFSYMNDNNNHVLFNNNNFFSNKYLISSLIVNNFDKLKLYENLNSFVFNNYYPILFTNNLYSKNFFLKKFTYNNNKINFLLLTNKIILNFFEFFLKKKIFLKTISNHSHKLTNFYFNCIRGDFKKYQPQYLKNFLILDFIEILWYSFFIKDLKMISEWISKLMESLNFKNHKKFLTFFNNFINKYANIFIEVLKIKGFFFDIRGKVGVTGSSKKRHFCFKFGSINKSSKRLKIDFNQNLVRTYSGVMGLTYIINY